METQKSVGSKQLAAENWRDKTPLNFIHLVRYDTLQIKLSGANVKSTL